RVAKRGVLTRLLDALTVDVNLAAVVDRLEILRTGHRARVRDTRGRLELSCCRHGPPTEPKWASGHHRLPPPRRQWPRARPEGRRALSGRYGAVSAMRSRIPSTIADSAQPGFRRDDSTSNVYWPKAASCGM